MVPWYLICCICNSTQVCINKGAAVVKPHNLILQKLYGVFYKTPDLTQVGVNGPTASLIRIPPLPKKAV